MVMLDCRNIKTTRLNKSLDYKNLRPFKVAYIINNMAYKLELLKGLDIFPVFHLQLLHLDNSDLLPSQTEAPPPPIQVDDEGGEYFVDKVLDSQIDKRRKDPATGKKGYLIYKFRWTGHESDIPKQELYINTVGYLELIANFHYNNPKKVGPYKLFKTPEDWEPLLAALTLVCLYQKG